MIALSNNSLYPLDSVNASAGGLLPVTISKNLSAPWVAGDGQGGLDIGIKAANATYHAFLIEDSGAYDVLLSGSATNPTLPGTYSVVERLGAILTDGLGNIRPFYQVPGTRQFFLRTALQFLTGASNGVAPVLRSVPVPIGVKVEAELAFTVPGSTTGYLICRDPDLCVPAVQPSEGDWFHNAGPIAGTDRIWTNASGQIYTADTSAVGSPTLNMYLRGWFDPCQ